MVISPINLVQIAIAGGALSVASILVFERRMLALTLLLAIFGTHMALNFLEEAGLLADEILITPAIGALYAPLVFLMTRDLVKRDGGLRLRDAVHAAPAFLALLSTMVLPLARVIVVTSTFAYTVGTIVLIRRHDRYSDHHRSDADSVKFNWVFGIFAAFGGLTLLDGVRMMTIASQPVVLRDVLYAAVLLAAAGLLGVLTIRSLQRRNLFDQLALQTVVEPAEDLPPSDDDELPAFTSLQAEIVNRCLYREPHVTLSDIANATNRTERDISRLINGPGGKTFNDFINGLRARAVASLLESPEAADVRILDLALDQGFTSKSTFNAAFKKELGVTPSAWRRQSAVQASRNTISDDATSAAP